MSTKLNAIVKKAARDLLNMFETGKMPEAVALTIIKRKEGDDQPSFKWSMGNQILMFIQGTSDARGFRQWQAVGRHVKKGAKAVHILAPVTRKFTEKDAESGTNKQKTIVLGFKAVPVFCFEDTEGKPIDRPDYTPRALPEFWEVAEYLGIEVDFTPCDGAYYGSFSPKKNKMILCSEDKFVFYHELAHAVHHTLRDLKPGPDPEKEIVAETTAAILCHLQGVEGYECQAYEYVQEYASKMKEVNVVKVIMRVLGDVEAVVLRILEVAKLIESSQVEQTA